MSYSLTVTGPLNEAGNLREEILSRFGGDVAATDLREVADSLLSPGKFGDSPIVSFIIEFSAGISVTGAIALTTAIRDLISKRGHKVTVKESQVETNDSETESEHE